MNSNEIIRQRRQMQRRIRDVVAERRLSRQQDTVGIEDASDVRPDDLRSTGETLLAS
ncbi:hypothetical protein AB0J86_21815 [Micromonospora sp. NPDC049559]|uniref:hypothetical protein n=1 Tax=Micromonospora sp. NPDC049559 TaxID=3155923 RepID=UPI0034357C37